MKGYEFIKQLKTINECENWYMIVNDTRVYLKIYDTKLVYVLAQAKVRLLDSMDLVNNKFYKDGV